MHIEQLYTNCLAEAAYYIESEGEAIIIDPLRDIETYIELAEKRGAKIKYVLETHFHADFVSGHIDLASRTGAKIVFGPQADTSYDVYLAEDGEYLTLGNLKMQVLHTPGHTPESTSYLLLDENEKPQAIFTGDTLFVGDVGRPDLLDGKMSKEELAGMMYDSLKAKIMPLPDDVIVYPGHGPGSACGKNIGKETFSTIGQQKRTNYALQEMSKETFIAKLSEGILPPPKYFFQDAKINKEGYKPIDVVLKENLRPLSPEKVQALNQEGVLILDSRKPEEFEKGHIEGAMNVGLNGQYAVWVGTLLDIEQPLLIVAEEGKEEETILRLARIGFENIKGFLQGGMAAWGAANRMKASISSVSPEEMKNLFKQGHVLLDVRKAAEFEAGHVKGASLNTLADLEVSSETLDKTKTYLVHCAGGYRSMIAASILKAKGFKEVINVYGGYGAIKETGIALEEM